MASTSDASHLSQPGSDLVRSSHRHVFQTCDLQTARILPGADVDAIDLRGLQQVMQIEAQSTTQKIKEYMEQSRKVTGRSKKSIVKAPPADIAKPDGIEKPMLVKASNIARRRQAALAEGGADYTAKRDELVQLAVKLFQEKGFKATTLNDLSKASGLERATLYYYVSSKEELLQEAIQGMLKSNVDEASRIARLPDLGPKEKLKLLFEMLMTSYEDNYPHMYVYIQELMHEVPHESSPWAKQMLRQTRNFEKMAMALIVQGIEEGIFRSDVSARIATNAIFGMFNWTHRWFKPNGKQSGREVADTFCKIFLEGISCKPS